MNERRAGESKLSTKRELSAQLPGTSCRSAKSEAQCLRRENKDTLSVGIQYDLLGSSVQQVLYVPRWKKIVWTYPLIFIPLPLSIY